MKNLKVLLTVGVVAGVAALLYFYFGAKTPDDKGRKLNLTATVERRTISCAIDSPGDIKPLLQVDVKPEVSARILKIFVVIGQVVKQGDLLLQLDDKELLTEKSTTATNVRGAEVALEKAQREFVRAQRLFEHKLVSQEFYENARTEVDDTENNFRRAQTQLQSVLDRLDKTKIMSPLSGTVLSLPIVEGQVVVAAASVSSGTLLMSIADLSHMYISTHINQVDIAQVSMNQLVDVTVDSIHGLTMDGRVTLVSPVATVISNVKGFDVYVTIEKLDPRVKPGMTADVSFPVSNVKDALSVPLAAVFTEGEDKKVVYLSPATPEDKARKQTVEIGIANYDFAQVKKGVDEGQSVLLFKPTSVQ